MTIDDVQSNVKSFADKADDMRKQTADSFSSAAESVRTAGKDAGRKLDSAASCIRDFEMLGGLREQIRQNPVRSIAVATALGLVAGIAVRSCNR
jgi:ElaB/YqjD/DUF883 family membrane-anchored ribosome-binding protein